MPADKDTSASQLTRGESIDAAFGVAQLVGLALFILAAMFADSDSPAQGVLFFFLVVLSWVLPIIALGARAQPDQPPGPPSAHPIIPCGQCGIDLKPGAVQCHWCHWRMPPAPEDAQRTAPGKPLSS